ncbi:hypothetical protein ABZU76_18045 [Amycolatopsis sp. NPDC005232]|uniref:non-homologous end-joining DNA ligase LigD n=1 Tax=Amycolatopsis sp. NPDC005232 TaxID=3157027 RepID=UPI00339E94E1
MLSFRRTWTASAASTNRSLYVPGPVPQWWRTPVWPGASSRSSPPTGSPRRRRPAARRDLQLYCEITTNHASAPATYAKQFAQHLANETPDALTSVMAKAQRTGKVFIDWQARSECVS